MLDASKWTRSTSLGPERIGVSQGWTLPCWWYQGRLGVPGHSIIQLLPCIPSKWIYTPCCLNLPPLENSETPVIAFANLYSLALLTCRWIKACSNFSSFSHSSFTLYLLMFSPKVSSFFERHSLASRRNYLSWTAPSIIPQFFVPLVKLSFILCFPYILILISSSLLSNIISSMHKLYTYLAYV